MNDITNDNCTAEGLPAESVCPRGAEPGHTILLLDDDAQFRELVTHLLQSHGYVVWNAKDAHEAFCQLANAEPDMIIVDYRLPGMDGITWISKLRKAGKNMPILLCTGAWMDPHTFNWLRNMLKVCMIVQKPIVPDLFLQTIESVLPPSSIRHDETPISVANPGQRLSTAEQYQLYERMMHTDAAHLSIEELDRLSAHITDTALVQELKGLRRKMVTQQAINAARATLLQRLPDIWQVLTSALQVARESFDDQPALQDAVLTAHKLKGSLGSYGLERLSKTCEKIEELLHSIDPSCKTECQLIWSEITRCGLEGSELIRCGQENSMPSQSHDSGLSAAPAMALLVVGCVDEELTDSIGTAARDSGFVPQFSHSAMGALNKSQVERFDAAIIDMNLEDSSAGFELERRLRSIDNLRNIPFCLISKETTNLTAGAGIYAGASAVVKVPCSEQALSGALNAMHECCLMQKSRILCVDDDAQLTSFLEAVLTGAGYSVRSLHEPVSILEAMKEYQPDLILMDVLMPGLSGYDVCRMLKAQEAWKHVPVIFLTAKADTRSRSSAFQAGGADFLPKPIVVDELLVRVHSQLLISTGQSSGANVLVGQRFETKAEDLLEACRRDKRDCSLGLIAIPRYSDLDAAQGAYTAEQLSASLSGLLSVRLRACDLRGQLDKDRFAILLPGENLKTMDELLVALREDYMSLFCYERLRSAPPLATAAVALGIDGNSLHELVSMGINQLRATVRS